MAEIATNFTETGFSAMDINKNFVNTAIPLSIAFGLLSTAGIFGNSFILYVYLTKYPVCNFRYFVISLGIIDLIRSLLTIPSEIYIQYTWFVGPMSGICKTKIFFNTVSITYSTCILLLIGIDRFRKACRPHGWQMQPESALKLSIALGTLAIAWSVPSLVFCGPQTFRMNYAGSKVTVTICLKDNAYKDTAWPFLLLNILYAGPITIMMITTLILYVLIAKAIFKRTKRRTGMKATSAPMRTENENEVSMDASVAELSDTAIEASTDDSEAHATTNNVQPEKPKSEGTLTSSTSNGGVYVKVGSTSPTFLFNIPVLDIKAVQDRPSEPTHKTFKKPLSNLYSRASKRRQRTRMRRNTLIMFILTLCFVISILVYFILAIQMADTERFFNTLTLWQGVLVMFFLRLYYFIILINIVVYGLLDPRFRRALRRASRRMSGSVNIYRHRRR